MTGWEREERRDEPAGPLPYEPSDPPPLERDGPPWLTARPPSGSTQVARRVGTSGDVTSVGGLLIAFAVGSAILVALAVAFIVLYRFVTGDPG